MPELPEVETTLRGIESHILNKKISCVIVRQPSLRWVVPQDLIRKKLEGNTFSNISRRGKYLLLESSDENLIIHLGMSGSLRIAKEEGIKNNEDKDEAIMEPAIEKIKDIVEQMPQETLEVDEIVDEINKKINDDVIADLDETLGQLPMFEPVETAGPKEEAEEEPSLSTMEKVSLDENLKTGEFNIGLNDRLAFVNHLFENNNEDYDRVLSQLTTMDSFEEISDFIENIIKPDYNNWDDKADYESRFLEIIEKKFK